MPAAPAPKTPPASHPPPAPHPSIAAGKPNKPNASAARRAAQTPPATAAPQIPSKTADLQTYQASNTPTYTHPHLDADIVYSVYMARTPIDRTIPHLPGLFLTKNVPAPRAQRLAELYTQASADGVH